MTHRPSTEALIRSLAASPPPPPLTARSLAGPVVAALTLSLGVFLWLIGLRADLAQVLADPAILAKSLLPLALAVPALVLALRSARPGRVVRPGLLILPAAAALALFLARGVQVPSGQILPELLGHSAAACLLSITALSAPATLAGLIVLRRGASLRPARTGALIGMAAAAGTAAGYALHCTEDSPLFFTTWYGLAILIGTGIGALAGHRLLRW